MPVSPEQLEAYVQQLSDMEKKVLQIAKKHRGAK